MAISDLPTCLRTCTLASEYNSTWTPIVGGLIIIVFLGISILFMISRAMNRRDWEAMARLELYHLSVAVIWVTIIGIAANLTCSIVCSITDEESPFTSAINYAANVNAKLSTLFQNLYEKAKTIRIETSYYFAVANLLFSPRSGCENIANVYENFAFMLSPFIASMMAQQYALILISQIAFQFILPIGIILRLIPGFKDAAAYLIGIAFALYIVLPLTYIIAEKSTEGLSITLIDNDGFDCLSVNEIQIIMNDIGILLPQAVFFPALSSIITIGAARALADVFKYDFAELKGE